MKRLLCGLVVCFFPLLAQGANLTQEYLDNSEIESVSIMPIKKIKKIRFKDGVVVYASENLRYIFDGEFKDNWLGSNIETLNEYQIEGFEGSGVNPEEISIPLTDGKKLRYLFLAPECLECKSLVRQIEAHPVLPKIYDFRVILLSSSSRGFDINTAIWCSKDKRKRLKSVYEGGQTIDNDNNSACNPLALMTSNTVAEAFGIPKLPAVMDDKGVVFSGKSELIITELE